MLGVVEKGLGGRNKGQGIFSLQEQNIIFIVAGTNPLPQPRRTETWNFIEASEKTPLKFSLVQCTRIYFFADYVISLQMQSRLYDADLYSVQVTSLSWSSTLKKYVYTICIILIYCIFILKKKIMIKVVILLSQVGSNNNKSSLPPSPNHKYISSKTSLM